MTSTRLDRESQRGKSYRKLGAGLLVLLLLATVACAGDPKEARTRSDFCFWFDVYLNVLEDEDAATEEVDQATRDLIGAGVAFGIRGNAPGIKMDIDTFAAALDNRDLATVNEFINNTLLYCEDLIEPGA